MPDRIDEQVGANLKKIRTVRGMSRAKLGESLGVAQQTIEKYENGIIRIDAAVLVKAAFFLGCTVMDLLHDVDLIIDDRNAPDSGLHKKTDQDMMKHYHDLQSPELQAAVRNLTRAMVLQLSQNFKPK